MSDHRKMAAMRTTMRRKRHEWKLCEGRIELDILGLNSCLKLCRCMTSL